MDLIEQIIAVAKAEWEFFGRQEFDISGRKIRSGKAETDEGFWQRVGIFWRDGTGKNLTGKNDDFPWSATFISYVMRKAGAGERFRYNAQHSVYIREAIKARERANKKYGFWGFRITERSPEIGDLVCYAREPGISFDIQSASYKSHADIVIAKSGNAIQVLGGNVGNSVSVKSIKISGNSSPSGRFCARMMVLFATRSIKSRSVRTIA